MYLGIMGWIGSILTVRGIQLLTQLKHEAKAPEERYLSITAPTTEVAKVSEIPEPSEHKERKKEG